MNVDVDDVVVELPAVREGHGTTVMVLEPAAEQVGLSPECVS